jgi:hypothetical protein
MMGVRAIKAIISNQQAKLLILGPVPHEVVAICKGAWCMVHVNVNACDEPVLKIAPKAVSLYHSDHQEQHMH